MVAETTRDSPITKEQDVPTHEIQRTGLCLDDWRHWEPGWVWWSPMDAWIPPEIARAAQFFPNGTIPLVVLARWVAFQRHMIRLRQLSHSEGAPNNASAPTVTILAHPPHGAELELQDAGPSFPASPAISIDESIKDADPLKDADFLEDADILQAIFFKAAWKRTNQQRADGSWCPCFQHKITHETVEQLPLNVLFDEDF